MAEPVTTGLPYLLRIPAGMIAMQAPPTAHKRPASRPIGEMLSVLGSPPVAIKNVPPNASKMPRASRVRGSRCAVTQAYPMTTTSCRHWKTVAVPALVRRTADR